MNKEAPDPLAYTNTIVVHQNFGQPAINKITEDDEVNVICKNNICVYGLDSVGSESNQKVKKVINDVSVIISTSDDAKKQFKDDDDVPVVKGYKGVRPEDINPDVDDDDDAKPKNDNEQPSIIVTHLPKAGGTVVIDTDKHGVQKPSFTLQPPVYQAPNWRNNINWKSRIPNIDQPSPPYYHNDIPQPPRRQYYHHELPESPNTQYYENDVRRHNVYETYNRDVRIPSGFASNWRPIIPQAPTDHYHYNVNGRANDFSGWTPRYATVCSCSRKPVTGNGPVQPRRPNPWYPETTTQMHIDDKLAKPFSKTNK